MHGRLTFRSRLALLLLAGLSCGGLVVETPSAAARPLDLPVQATPADADRVDAVLAAAGLAEITAVDLIGDIVVVRTLSGTLEEVQAVVGGEATVVEDETANAAVAPAACTDRVNCGVPLRGGIRIFSEATGAQCSLGFTANATDGSRWILSAGHCGFLDENWKHGNERIGLVRQRYNADVQGRWFDAITGGRVWLDFMRVRNSSSYWLSGTFGWMYSTPSSPVAVNGAAAASSLSPGDVICRSSWSPYHADLAPNCGTVYSTYGGNGEIAVSGMIVCAGDSGGSVYVVDGGQRIAVGVISAFYYDAGGPPPNCRQSPYNALVSPIDSIYHYMDLNSIAQVRVDAR